jgi:monoamine oxidase
MGLSRRDFLLATSALATAGIPARLRASTASGVDVIVIGAGLSGLAAALTLQEAGARVLVLEAQQRIGGKMLSFAQVPGTPEAGGQSIAPGYGRVIEAARRYGVPLEDVLPGAQRHPQVELALGGSVIAAADWPSSPLNPFPEPARAAMPWQYAAGLLARSNPLAPGAVWYDAAQAVHDRSLFDFLRAQGAPEAAIQLAYDTNVSYGTSAHDVSALQMMFIEAWGRMQRQIKPVAVYRASGGNQRIPEAMARALEREVRLGVRVKAIQQDDNSAVIHCADGTRLRAAAVICALPFSVLRELAFEPRLNGVQYEAVRTLPHQPVTQLALVARRPYWKEDGLSPSMWCDGLLARTFAHREGDEVVSILATAYGNKATTLDRLGRDGAARRVIAELEALRPAASGQLEAVAWHSWGLDPHAAGTWAVFAPGTVTRFMPHMFAPHGRLHFCGEQTALANRGMEGAMESGERAAIEAMDHL